MSRMDEMPRSHSKSVTIQHVNTVQEVFKVTISTKNIIILSNLCYFGGFCL